MSDQQKETVSRWAPTLIALIAILGNLLWISNRAGQIEQRVVTNEKSLTNTVTRAEYLADKASSVTQFADVKSTLRDISSKLDRMIEVQRKP